MCCFLHDCMSMIFSYFNLTSSTFNSVFNVWLWFRKKFKKCLLMKLHCLNQFLLLLPLFFFLILLLISYTGHSIKCFISHCLDPFSCKWFRLVKEKKEKEELTVDACIQEKPSFLSEKHRLVKQKRKKKKEFVGMMTKLVFLWTLNYYHDFILREENSIPNLIFGDKAKGIGTKECHRLQKKNELGKLPH